MSKSVAQFMQDAMYEQNIGYYVARDPIGKHGDFITAPEISQLFGEMLAIHCLQQWQAMGSPKQFNLCELGPGRATLILDLLRATKHVAGFSSALKLHFVEINQQHIALQKEKINQPAVWHQDIYSLPSDLPMIIIANEFFDCLPIHQYIFEDKQWYERYIDGDHFIHILSPPHLNNSLQRTYHNVKPGSIIEVCYQAQETIKYLTSLNCHILIIDYGYDERSDYISTLQAVKDHRYHSIFEDIGKADLTAQVDFSALRSAALSQNANASHSITQREFLQGLGIELRAKLLKLHANEAQKKTIDSGLARLIDHDQMGDLFKVMTITSSKALK